MDQVASQVLADKSQMLDKHTEVLSTLSEAKERWTTTHMHLSGHLHATTESCHALRADLSTKIDSKNQAALSDAADARRYAKLSLWSKETYTYEKRL
jgi:hypothetical protein